MENTLQSVVDWLRTQENRSLTIRKEEEGHTDTIDLELQEVQIRERQPYDDYIAEDAILLRGEGRLHNGEELVPLPGDSFEIPITDRLEYVRDSGRTTIRTDRAVYDIETK
jgi:hypothetical protein